jgi:probable F420-dependent oxidoreductase
LRFFNALIGSEAIDHVTIARTCEAAGFDGVAVSDHVFFPETLESKYPYTADGRPQYDPDEEFPDVWVSVGAMAASTSTLRFMTNVYILPLRNPFVVAQSVGTAAYLSGNRVELGVGAGWMREEFDQLGQPFNRRGKRLDEGIDVLRALWAGGMVEHHGDSFDFDRLEMRPVPSAPIPFLVGGHSEVALRRAARNDGWIGVNYSLEQLRGHLEQLHRCRDEAGTVDRPFEVVASPLAVPSPETVEELESMGVTTILTSAWIANGVKRPSFEQAVEFVEGYSDKFIKPLRS